MLIYCRFNHTQLYVSTFFYQECLQVLCLENNLEEKNTKLGIKWNRVNQLESEPTFKDTETSSIRRQTFLPYLNLCCLKKFTLIILLSAVIITENQSIKSLA